MKHSLIQLRITRTKSVDVLQKYHKKSHTIGLYKVMKYLGMNLQFDPMSKE